MCFSTQHYILMMYELFLVAEIHPPSLMYNISLYEYTKTYLLSFLLFMSFHVKEYVGGQYSDTLHD